MEFIDGTLQIDNKIWFNDKERCRLRICGFTKEQIERLKKSIFIDITLIQQTDNPKDGAIAFISFEESE